MMKITRRDFVNGVLVGSGAALLASRVPSAPTSPLALTGQVGEEWYGYGGVGDYSSSHGNTPEVTNTAHNIRNGKFADLPKNMPVDEEYDLVIVGGGMAGLGAAWHFRKSAGPGQRCLLLENHPIFGGESKENVFEVEGERLLGPQGANGFFIPPEASDPEQAEGDARYYAEFNIPRNLDYRELSADFKSLRLCKDNYGFSHWMFERHYDTGYFYETPGGNTWVKNPWSNQLTDVPISPAQRQALTDWRESYLELPQNENNRRYLDSITYKDLLERKFKLDSIVAQYADDFLGGNYGQGSDVISAYAAQAVNMPGTMPEEQVRQYWQASEDPVNRRQSFPGGNSGYARYFLKHINPEAIAGDNNFDDIITGNINFNALDREGQSVRIRLRSTVVSVEHEGDPDKAGRVNVLYTRAGKLYRIRARGVVMASGGWINKYIVKDLPFELNHAYQQFTHAPFLVANVALSNWRFLYELGITCATWRYGTGFGVSCNIRPPMLVGDRPAPLDPEKPIVLTFYVPMHTPGLPPKAQGIQGRAKLLMTSYADYEKQIIAQLNKLFGASGFKAENDVRGIILNRWGHAYVVPTPGYLIDTPGKKAPVNIIREGFGRVRFGHSELRGWQHWGPAADEGRRAVEQLSGAI